MSIVDIVNASATVILVLINVFYIILTWIALTESRKATAYSRSLADRELELRLAPRIFPVILHDSKTGMLNVKLQNRTDNDAIDVDVMISASYGEERLEEMRSLAKVHVAGWGGNLSQSRLDKKNWLPTPDGFFGIYDRLIYENFARRSSVATSISFPAGENSFQVFVQYRSELGINYGRVYWLTNDGRGRLTLQSASPTRHEKMPRIETVGDAGLFGGKNKQRLPKSIPWDFVDVARASRSSKFLGLNPDTVSDRGDWTYDA